MAFSGQPDETYKAPRLDCGCRWVLMGEPVNRYVRTWTSECTIAEHLPKSKQAS